MKSMDVLCFPRFFDLLVLWCRGLRFVLLLYSNKRPIVFVGFWEICAHGLYSPFDSQFLGCLLSGQVASIIKSLWKSQVATCL